VLPTSERPCRCQTCHLGVGKKPFRGCRNSRGAIRKKEIGAKDARSRKPHQRGFKAHQSSNFSVQGDDGTVQRRRVIPLCRGGGGGGGLYSKSSALRFFNDEILKGRFQTGGGQKKQSISGPRGGRKTTPAREKQANPQIK